MSAPTARPKTAMVLAAGRGAIVHIASISALHPAARQPPYGAIKAAVIHYTATQAAMYAKDRIRVNCIAPGAIKTDALATVLTPEIEQAMLKHTPLGRLGEADDIANAALFLCSPAASLIAGTDILVDALNLSGRQVVSGGPDRHSQNGPRNRARNQSQLRVTE